MADRRHAIANAIFHRKGHRSKIPQTPGSSFHAEVLIVGAGPAGMAAAYAAAQSSESVLVIDDSPSMGGQIWRGEEGKNLEAPAEARAWFERMRHSTVVTLGGVRVISQTQAGALIGEGPDACYELTFQKLIIATGAHERFLPFPGWTLPNVMGAGGLQALVKGGLPVRDKRVVVAGSGPLLLAVAAYLRKSSADVLLVAEQARRYRLLRFSLGLISQPKRASQALQLRRELKGTPYLPNCWVIAAEGQETLESVRIRRGREEWSLPCDYLACGFHLIPNVELPLLLGCDVSHGSVAVDEFQQTSVPNIYCAGEPTGIGGLELSLIEGQIAGLATVGQHHEARKLFSASRKLRKFANLLNETFAPRDELKKLPDGETNVCRCEDVTFDRLTQYDSWRIAKLQTRCGMGPCQGRICGPATQFLFGWPTKSVRPPIFPARVSSLARLAEDE